MLKIIALVLFGAFLGGQSAAAQTMTLTSPDIAPDVDIPPDVTSLAKNAGDPKGPAAPKGAVQSRTDFGVPGYGGPCPPQGDPPHHYHFTVFAVDAPKLDGDENTTAAFVGFMLHFHTLAQATLTGVWGH